jgi:hypothetical protein
MVLYYILHAILIDFSRLPERLLAAAGVFSAAGNLAALATPQLGNGRRHQSRCHRHRHPGMLILSPTSEHSGNTLGSLILVSDLFWHRIFFCYNQAGKF